MRRKAAKWMDRPSGPGWWVCYGPKFRPTVTDLNQDDIDNGAPFATTRVYGPIPLDDRCACGKKAIDKLGICEDCFGG